MYFNYERQTSFTHTQIFIYLLFPAKSKYNVKMK